ncbi:MAG: HAMP domain-containing protein [Clostridia bacterium]|nr:HAMP domain-containing protein [Clostridia bacterium]
MSKGTKLSIKTRITVWYAVLLVAICTFAFVVLAVVSERAADTYCRDTLLSAATVIIDELDIEEGELELDTDIDEVPGVYASLFEQDGTLLYGRDRVRLPFAHEQIREANTQEDNWYIYDVLLDVVDRDSVWLRVYMSSNVNESVFRSVISSGAWIVLLLAALALGGGYWITAQAFRPVKEMSDLASSIAGGNDLSRRIRVGGRSADELHILAETLNAMLSRLEGAFVRESRFASDAAHELRTPLNALRTQGEYALSCEDSEEKDEAIGRMLEKSEEMQALVDQLLMIARMDAGEIALEDTCDLEQMLRCIADDMGLVAEERSIRIEVRTQPCVIRGNRAMLNRAVINLVDNAIRYGQDGGFVKISLQIEGESAVIAVEDNGCGIEEEALAHVFERFWRADSARAANGTGIGLSIVQSAVQAHGGSVTVSSDVGRGSRFVMTLPHQKTE